MLYQLKNTSVSAHFSGSIKKSLLGKWSQRVDPTLPYYKPEFDVYRQPILSLSLNSSYSSHPTSKHQHLFFGFLNSSAKVGSLMSQILLNWIILIILLGVGAMATLYLGPKLYYSYFYQPSIVSDTNQNRDSTLLGQLVQQQQPLDTQELLDSLESRQVEEDRYLPPVDSSLPQEDLIMIPKIGVNTQLQRTETEEEALDSGAWWVPDFGIPGDLLKPMIVVGHRYGWEWWWKSDYWQLHSFYRLPLLEVGDRVEIISEQRKFVYEIYSGEEGEQISDYDADLILYTCKHLNSPIRYFRYAKIVKEL